MKKIFTFFAVMLCFAGAGMAQTSGRIFNFKKGDQYKRTTNINSACTLQRTKQMMQINSSSSIVKTYTVTDSTADGYVFSVAVKSINCDVDIDSKKLNYNTDKSDTNSYISMALSSLVNNPAIISINKNGVITAVNDPAEEMDNDTLLSFAGIQAERFVKGADLVILADIIPDKAMKTGYTWGDSSSVDDRNIKNIFKIDQFNNEATNLVFESSAEQKNLNVNAAGVYTVENASGIIRMRATRSISRGRESMNNVVYNSQRSTALAEACNKIN